MQTNSGCTRTLAGQTRRCRVHPFQSVSTSQQSHAASEGRQERSHAALTSLTFSRCVLRENYHSFNLKQRKGQKHKTKPNKREFNLTLMLLFGSSHLPSKPRPPPYRHQAQESARHSHFLAFNWPCFVSGVRQSCRNMNKTGLMTARRGLLPPSRFSARWETSLWTSLHFIHRAACSSRRFLPDKQARYGRPGLVQTS